MKNEIISESEVNELYNNIKKLIDYSRNNMYRTINIEMINLYWNIGKIIVEKQEGKVRANYGDYLIESISNKLTDAYGKGFSKTNLKNMRMFYSLFPIGQTLSDQLSWSHYLELIKIKDENKRNFYMQECINSKMGCKRITKTKNYITL